MYWQDVPLLFDMTVDVAESNPLVFGTPKHTAAWKLVNETQTAMLVFFYHLFFGRGFHYRPGSAARPFITFF
jgi:hypothetical protein